MKKIYTALNINKYRRLIDPKIYIFDKTLVFLSFAVNVVTIMVEYLKKKKVLRC